MTTDADGADGAGYYAAGAVAAGSAAAENASDAFVPSVGVTAIVAECVADAEAVVEVATEAVGIAIAVTDD